MDLLNGNVETVVLFMRQAMHLRNAQYVNMQKATLKFGVKTTNET